MNLLSKPDIAKVSAYCDLVHLAQLTKMQLPQNFLEQMLNGESDNICEYNTHDVCSSDLIYKNHYTED